MKKKAYQEEVQLHELLRHQQVPEQKGHMQQVHNYEQDWGKTPAEEVSG